MSDIKPIVGLGSPILREICTPIEGDHQGRQIITEIKATFEALTNCYGIAAPQINYSVRMFIMMGENKVPYVCINPQIIKRRGRTHFTEGCMSIPKVYERVDNRDDILDVEYYDDKFMKVKRRIRGFEAIVFQHEYDHLNGVLFIDHLTKEGRDSIQEKLLEIESGIAPTIYDMIFPETNVTHKKETK